MEGRRDHQTEARKLLVADTFMGSLPDTAVDSLMSVGHIRRLAAGQPLFERGDVSDSLFLILAGRVKISNVTVDAREVVLNFLGRGDVLGEIAALDGGPRTADATALDATEVFQLYRRDFLPILKAHPAALVEIIGLLCEKLRATSAIVEDSLRDMSGRFAAGLLRLARQHGRRTQRGIEIDLAVNQRDLGNYLGLSRENTSRQLNALVQDGLVVHDRGVIVILDEPRLQALTERER